MNVKKFVKYYVIKYRKEEFLCGSILVIIICLSLITPKLVQYFIDKVLPAKKIEGVILFAAAYIGVYLLIALLSILSKRIITSIENKIMTEVREKMYSNLLYQPLGYYRENK
ncbi:MAG: ABC transporter ATP-binding protein, partial [Clostridiaceae bacterium]|nr:ABC transporter ATP-binding protein [Clostridiaceae bacterium]